MTALTDLITKNVEQSRKATVRDRAMMDQDLVALRAFAAQNGVDMHDHRVALGVMLGLIVSPLIVQASGGGHAAECVPISVITRLGVAAAQIAHDSAPS